MTGVTPKIAVSSTWELRAGARIGRVHELIAAFHERHVPLTVKLAQRYVEFEACMPPARDRYWGRAFLRSAEALGVKAGFGYGAIWARSIQVFPLIIAEPVLRRAAASVGELPIYSETSESFGAPANPETEKKIELFVNDALDDCRLMGVGFWQLAGLALQGAALTGAVSRTHGNRALPPEIEIPVARLVFGVEAVFPEDDLERLRKLKPKARSVHRRSGIRPKEGGVVGILRSQRIEDFADAVISELALPEELVANRLFDEGLVVRHRPPMREPKRDLLAMTLCDRQSESSAACLFKAAWADASLRLGMYLQQLGFPDSHLIWAERGPVRQSTNLVEAAAISTGLHTAIDPMKISGAGRCGTLMRTGLFPSFVDSLAGIGKGGEMSANADLPDFIAEMAGGALSCAKRTHLPGMFGGSEKEIQPQGYAHRTVIVLVDGEGATARALRDSWSALSPQIDAALRRGFRQVGARFALVLAPSKFEPGAEFEFFSGAAGACGTVAVIDAEEDIDAIAKALGGLSAWMIRWTLEAMDAG